MRGARVDALESEIVYRREKTLTQWHKLCFPPSVTASQVEMKFAIVHTLKIPNFYSISFVTLVITVVCVKFDISSYLKGPHE